MCSHNAQYGQYGFTMAEVMSQQRQMTITMLQKENLLLKEMAKEAADVSRRLIKDLEQKLEKYEPKREYVKGSVAIEKLMSGEWKKIALDEKEWIRLFGYISLSKEHILDSREGSTIESLAQWRCNYGRWHEVKE